MRLIGYCVLNGRKSGIDTINDTNDVVYHSNIKDGYIVFWK